jgi:hypothetical protein
MKALKLPVALIVLFISSRSFSQAMAAMQGVWKGISICQIKNSPCHDENIVYHMLALDSLNLFQIEMNKIVNTNEENMGTLNFKYIPSEQIFICTDALVSYCILSGNNTGNVESYQEENYSQIIS